MDMKQLNEYYRSNISNTDKQVKKDILKCGFSEILLEALLESTFTDGYFARLDEEKDSK